LIQLDPNQLSLLGDLVRNSDSEKLVLSILRSIAEMPSYYGILNSFIREHPEVLTTRFAFLLNRKELLDFRNKQTWFQGNFAKEMMFYTSNRKELYNYLVIDRTTLIESTFDQIMNGGTACSGIDPKIPLHVSFADEPGYGKGVRREFFQVISAAIADPKCGLLKRCEHRQTFELSNSSLFDIRQYRFLGILLGMCLYHGDLISFRFSRPFLKLLLGKPVQFSDLEEVDPTYYRSLCWILESKKHDNQEDPVEQLGIHFNVEIKDDQNGEVRSFELLPGGKDLLVTNRNKRHFVELVAEWRLECSIKRKLEAIQEGIAQVFEPKRLCIFNENELELILSGVPKIDVNDWKRNTMLSGYKETDHQISWFWNIVEHSMDEGERALLLQFATGTSSIPMGGIGELQGINGDQKFTICAVHKSDEYLPTASTCFNMLKLPRYSSFEKMEQKLLFAIRFGHEGFSFS